MINYFRARCTHQLPRRRGSLRNEKRVTLLQLYRKPTVGRLRRFGLGVEFVCSKSDYQDNPAVSGSKYIG